MAQEPPRVIWSQESFDRFQELPFSTRQDILKRVRFLRSNPQMYQVETQGRWAGLRRFFVRAWVVFYAYWQPEDTIYIEAIVHARSDR